jgi:hypothetical protein
MSSLLRGTLRAKNIFGSSKKANASTNSFDTEGDATANAHLSPVSTDEVETTPTSSTPTPAKSRGGMMSMFRSASKKQDHLADVSASSKNLEAGINNGYDTNIKEITDAATVAKLDYQDALGLLSPSSASSASSPPPPSTSKTANKNGDAGKDVPVLRATIDDLRVQLEQEQVSSEEYRMQLEECNKLLDEYEEKLAKYKKDRKDILTAFKQTEQELDRLTNELDDAHAAAQTNKQELDVCEEYIEKIRQAFESHGYEEAAYERGFPQALEQLLPEFASMQTQQIVYEQTITQLNSDLQQAYAAAQTQTSPSQTHAQDTERPLQEDLEAATHLASSLQRTISMLQPELDAKSSENAVMMEKLLLTSHDDEQSPSKSASGAQSLAQQSADATQELEETVKSLEKQIHMLTVSSEAKDIIINQAGEREHTLTETNKHTTLKYEVEINEMRLLLSKSENANKSLQAQIDQLTAQGRDQERTNIEQQTIIAEITKQLEEIRSELQEAHDALSLRAEQARKYTTETTNWQTEKIDELNKIIVFLQQQALHQDIFSAQSQEETTFKMISLKSEISSLREANAMLTQKVEAFEANNHELLQQTINSSVAESKYLCNVEIYRGNLNAKEEELKVISDLCEVLTQELATLRGSGTVASGAKQLMFKSDINRNADRQQEENIIDADMSPQPRTTAGKSAPSASKSTQPRRQTVATPPKGPFQTNPRCITGTTAGKVSPRGTPQLCKTQQSEANMAGLTFKQLPPAVVQVDGTVTHGKTDGPTAAENGELTRKLLRGAMVSMISRSKNGFNDDQDSSGSVNETHPSGRISKQIGINDMQQNGDSSDYIAEYRAALTIPTPMSGPDAGARSPTTKGDNGVINSGSKMHSSPVTKTQQSTVSVANGGQRRRQMLLSIIA